MRRSLTVFFALLLASPAYPQSSKLSLDSEINTNWPDNTSGLITPALLRSTVTDIVASYVDWLTCTVQGGIVYWNSTATPTCLAAGTSGQFLKTQGAGANPTWATPSLPAADLTIAANNVVVGNKNGANQAAQELTVTGVLDIVGSTNGQTLNRAAGAWTGTATPTLGASGTLGSVTMGNATSGLLTIQPAAGALGAVTVLMPAVNDTAAVLAASQALTNKTYNGNTWIAGTGILSIAAAKTLTVSNSVSFTATDGSAVALGTGGTVTYTIASGAKTLNTTAVASATCSAEQTDTATGAATTDAISISFNGDPTAIAGYVPLTTGMLTIIPYPKSGQIGIRVCNNTAATITPAAVTLNWAVRR